MAQHPSGVGIVSPKLRDSSVVRRYVSQGGRGYLSLGISNGPDFVDPDPDTISLRVWYNDPTVEFPVSSDPRGAVVLTVDHTEINKEDVGRFYYDIGPELTTHRGVLTAEWTYQVGGKIFQYNDYLQILEQMPYYERLSEREKAVVERVSFMFGDLYDSTEGGPHLIEEFQTHYGYERIAQLQDVAMTRINTIGFGRPTQFGVGPNTTPPPLHWDGLVVIGTYLEVLRHLIRSYTEIPARPNMDVTYVDRRDYAQRWKLVYDMEYPEWKSAIRKAKLDMLSLGRSAVLVSGGIYGSSGAYFRSGTSAMQARALRFYPAAPAITGWH